MTKNDWTKYQVNNPLFGVKLVSELTEKQAKNELCFCIEVIEQILEFNENLTKIMTRNEKEG